MENIRNKIITISGEPASGKSTVVKEIKSKYEKQGFNVYIISVGDVFRETVKKEYLKRYPDRINVSLADIQNDKEFMAKLQRLTKKKDQTMFILLIHDLHGVMYQIHMQSD